MATQIAKSIDGRSTATVTAPPSTTTQHFTLPAPSDFTIDVQIIEKSCYGSYGCNVRYKIEPHYIGTQPIPIPSSTVFTVVYAVDGCEHEKPIHFSKG